LIRIKELLELNVNEASPWRLTSLNPDDGTKYSFVISFCRRYVAENHLMMPENLICTIVPSIGKFFLFRRELIA